jgi:altronate dehydratase small subunit
MNPLDNTATVVDLVEPSTDIFLEVDGQLVKVHVTERIAFGHKFAVYDIPTGGQIVKYGEKIGIATKDIKAGQHVHVHNLESGRGRGDR